MKNERRRISLQRVARRLFDKVGMFGMDRPRPLLTPEELWVVDVVVRAAETRATRILRNVRRILERGQESGDLSIHGLAALTVIENEAPRLDLDKIDFTGPPAEPVIEQEKNMGGYKKMMPEHNYDHDQYHSLGGAEVIADTEMAILVNTDEHEELWVPRSQILDYSELDCEAAKGATGELLVTSWWAKKAGV